LRLMGKFGDPTDGDGQEDPSQYVFLHRSPLAE